MACRRTRFLDVAGYTLNCMLSDLMAGIGAILQNAENYEEAEEYYSGECAEIFASAKMRRVLGPSGDAYRINLAKTPVDVLADRLTVAAVTVPDDEAVTTVLQEEIWDANMLLLNANDINRKACEYGDALVFVWPDPDDENVVQIIFNNPTNTRVIYDAETQTKPIFAVKIWPEGKLFRANLYYADSIERYITVENGKPADAESWSPFGDEETTDAEGNIVPAEWPLDNPYGKIPIWHLRTSTPYGVPEHKAAYGMQNAVNKLVATQIATIDYHGFPQRYALKEAGLAGEDEDDNIDWYRDDELAAVVSDQDRSKLKPGPAELWFMEGVKTVGQFAVADPENFLKPLQIYMRLMAQVTSTPLHYFDPSGDTPSGESLRASEGPLNKKVEDRQQRFGSTWSEIFSFALLILGYPDKKVEVRWASAGTIEDIDGWKTVALKIANGVPVRVALLHAGYTADQLDVWGIIEATTDIPLLRQIELVTQLSLAVQGLSTGVGFGIWSEEDVKALVDKIVTEEVAALT